jgi:tetratricopeptide (TPR) repeat protein
LVNNRSQFQDQFNTRQQAAQERVQNRPETREARHENLQSRLEEGGGRLDDRQDFREDSREDWQDFADDNYRQHYGWHNGCWEPGDRWDYMWDEYPGWAAFRTTVWGVNRLAYTFGYWDYSNPYYSDGSGGSASYNYAEPIVSYDTAAAPAEYVDPAQPAPATPGAAPSQPPAATSPGMASFEAARAAFIQGDYPTALTEVEKALKEMPNDAVVHEFRALILFSLKRYDEAAATIYAVLAVGPGWDWTTLSGLYPSTDIYVQQLRDLEAYVKQNPSSSQAHFLLAYHYLTCKQESSAAAQLKEVLKLTPGQKVATDMLTLIEGPEAVKNIAGAGEPIGPPPAGIPAPSVTTEQVTGAWKATAADGSVFELTLNADTSFIWQFSQGGKSESVRGVWALNGTTLAMEPDSGGTMLAELSAVTASGFTFRMAGAASNDPGLNFRR